MRIVPQGKSKYVDMIHNKLMKRKIYLNLLICICTILICFIFGEIGIRLIGFYDRDGNFFVFSRNLKPLRLPIKTTKEKFENNLFSPSSCIMHDSFLGWMPRPNSISSNELYKYNSFGVRSAPAEYLINPKKNMLRIAIFGNSFTHGDEVKFENTWGYYLENNLKKTGIDTEVLNFGVGGYGIDQAFLRWKKLGRKFSPNILILGFNLESVRRNVNIIRAIYYLKTGVPFSKPRFIIEGNHLKLINVPTLLPEKMIEVMENIQKWDLVKYEYFFNPKDYQSQILLKSKLISFIFSFISVNRFNYQKKERRFYSLKEEPAQLTIEIIHAFKKNVESKGIKFYIVHLPRRSDLINYLRKEKFIYSEFLKKIKENTCAILPENDMNKEAKNSSIDILFEKGGHYSQRANEIVAGAIAKFIMEEDVQMILN